MLILGIVYTVWALMVPWLYRYLQRAIFIVAAFAPFLTTIALIHQLPVLMASPGKAIEWNLTWIAELNFDLAMRMDLLTWVMLIVINGAGTLILLYCATYFPPSAKGLGRFTSFFLGFALSMNGLVLADHMLALYLFWELTALFSFLLIGHHFTFPNARGSARQAFLVTTLGSLAMFGGFFVVASVKGGSFLISQVINRVNEGVIDPTSTQFIVGVALIMLGALSKSAMVPFHFWLPAAMAAPTPVSAFLHAASMVKAGVYLIARLSPALIAVPGFRLLSVIGVLTMIVGAYRALRQRDLKLVLAYGTVSQLGFMVALASWGTPGTQLATVAVLLAHATFKSSLFLTTGTVEKLSGTRDLSELSGFGKKHPVLATSAAMACLSMAGVPITMGYLGKEVAISTLLNPQGALLLVGICIGSIMTVGYSFRYWWGAFATKKLRSCHDKDEVAPSGVITIPLILATLSVGLGFMPHVLEKVLIPVATLGCATPTADGLHLALWSGPVPALITAGILGGGTILFALRPKVWRAQLKLAVPEKFSAAHVYNVIVRKLEVWAGHLVALIQRGSLPYDLVTILITTMVAVGAAAWWGGVTMPTSIHLGDYWLQVELGIVIIVAAVLTLRAVRRLTAAVTLGVVGATLAALFFTFGGPDLALTQLVVEAVSLVIFVLVFRRLPGFFSERPMKTTRFFRAVLATLVGVGVVILGLMVTSARTHLPVSTLLPKEVQEFGHGQNIVNVILVDVRAWDTVGELTVLLVAALGVTSLVYVKAMSVYLQTPRAVRRKRLALRVREEDKRIHGIQQRQLRQAVSQQTKRPATEKGQSWLWGARALPFEQRSMIMEVSVRVLFHTLMLVSIWLLLIGHNNPGGGFVAGMTAGIALAVRYIAGGRFELFAAAPFKPGYVLGLGIFIAAAAGAIPVIAGNAPFQTIPINLDFGFAGQLHFTTAIFLDIGVYIVVMGVVLDILASLGSEIDRHAESQKIAKEAAHG